MFQLILGYMVSLRLAWDTRDSATQKKKIKPKPKVWKRNFLWKKHYLGWPCWFSGAPCISYSETHQNRDSTVERGSFRVTALDCTVFKVRTNSKPVFCHREGSRQREELLPGMVRINTLVPSSWTFTWDRTFMGCFCRARPGLFGCLSSCSAWSLQGRLKIYAPGQWECHSEYTTHVCSWLAPLGTWFLFLCLLGLKHCSGIYEKGAYNLAEVQQSSVQFQNPKCAGTLVLLVKRWADLERTTQNQKP